MRARFLGTAVVCSLVFGGCKGDSGGDGGGGVGGGGTGGAGPGGEEAAAATAAETTVGLQQMLLVADTLFAFDPDLDPNATDGANTETVRQNAVADGGACADVTLVLGGVRVDWGAGCVLPNSGIEVKGAIIAKIQKVDTGPLTASLEFEAFEANGYDLVGTTTFETENGSTFVVGVDLTHAGTTLTGSLDVVGAPTSITVGGSLGITDSSGVITLDATGIVFAPGDCYPSAGSVGLTSDPVMGPTLSGTLAFDAATVTSGLATLTSPLGSTCFALPAHGTCVPEACPAGGG